MALPSSGPLSIGDIRTELGMPSTSNFSLLNAFNSTTGYPILNPFSPVNPNSNPIKSIGAWRGYSSATINWINCWFGGVANLKIYVNGVLRLNDTNPSGTFTSGTLVVNNNDTFYATVTPITHLGFFSPPISSISTFRLLSPFSNVFPFFPPFSQYTTLNITDGPSPFATFSSPTQTVSIVPTNLGAYAIDIIV
jgi:hypothetical protein